MTSEPDFPPNGRALREQVGQAVFVVIGLDLLTLGLYSVVRSYQVHRALVKETGRRLFADGFLDVLLVLNFALLVLHFTRDHQPLDAALIFTRLGASLLFISLLLIFRRSLRQQFGLRVEALPLGIFGFWYLQYRLNRLAKPGADAPRNRSPSRWCGSLAALIYVGLSLLIGGMKQVKVPSTSMEPTLTVGDRVLVDPFVSTVLFEPERADLLAFTSPQDKNVATVERVLGLPGDHLSFHGDSIRINDQALDCTPTQPQSRAPGFIDPAPKRSYRCSLNGKTFVLDYYQKTPLTAVEGDFVVPAHHYFMVGDNLHNAMDSRTLGPIPSHLIIGRAWARTLSYRWGEPIPWNRWFQVL